MLMPYDENDPLAKPRVSAFTQALAELGWTEGRNVRLDLRWFGDDTNGTPALARELVGQQPDIILAFGDAGTRRENLSGPCGDAAGVMRGRRRGRRIGVLVPLDENDPAAKSEFSAFTQALAGLGWAEGRNVRMDLRWGDDINRMRALAQELVGLQPDIIVTSGTVATAAVQRETRGQSR